MSIIAEEWRPVQGAEGRYEISSLGRVKSLSRTVFCGIRHGKPAFRAVPEKILKISLDKDGYHQVLIANKEGDPFKTIKVHKLVAQAFLGEKPNGMWVLHGSKGNADNSVDNLYYGTPLQNAQDRWRDGTMSFGEIHHKAKLTQEDVLAIRDRHSAGVAINDIAKTYGVNRSAIEKIISRVNWKWL
jgi:hypothetical protein